MRQTLKTRVLQQVTGQQRVPSSWQAGRTGLHSRFFAARRLCPGAWQVAWLTPSELFTPFYGRAVASFLLAEHARTAASGAPLHVFEVRWPCRTQPHSPSHA